MWAQNLFFAYILSALVLHAETFRLPEIWLPDQKNIRDLHLRVKISVEKNTYTHILLYTKNNKKFQQVNKRI